ncbi:hypothetical protein [Undibacterium sp. Di27W]|uniref:hypothetical protein n=1 Tax=Undibacterium sp. Di27W TaxID=3413036 RepID=UPI003BF4E420
MVEQDMAAADPKLTAAASSRLQQMLTAILEKLPAASHQHVKGRNFYLMWGPRSPKGGKKGYGHYMEAILSVDPLRLPMYDPAWKNAVVIYSTDFFMSWDDVYIRHSLAHEIAHTWHQREVLRKNRQIIDALEAAKRAGLYKNVASLKRGNIGRAYALTNDHEYFAELSAAYFIGGTYFPYSREDLKKYDPIGYRMVEDLWDLR